MKTISATPIRMSAAAFLIAASAFAGAPAWAQQATEEPTEEPAETPAAAAEAPKEAPAEESGEPAAAEQAPAAAPEPAQAQAQPAVRETHGAWQIRCSGEVCVMSQAGKDGGGNDVLEIQIRKLTGAKAPDGTAIPAAIQVVTPLGVLLPAGVRVKIDEKKERGLPYEVCTQQGCVVRLPVDNAFINEMKAGASAEVTLFVLPQREIPIKVSLSGFTKAFNALK